MRSLERLADSELRAIHRRIRTMRMLFHVALACFAIALALFFWLLQPAYSHDEGWSVEMHACTVQGKCYQINDEWMPATGYESKPECQARLAQMMVGLHSVMAQYGVQLTIVSECRRVGDPI